MQLLFIDLCLILFAFYTLDPDGIKGQVKAYFRFFECKILEVLTMCFVSWSTFNHSRQCLFHFQYSTHALHMLFTLLEAAWNTEADALCVASPNRARVSAFRLEIK